MSKMHIGKNGLDKCRAKGDCPLEAKEDYLESMPTIITNNKGSQYEVSCAVHLAKQQNLKKITNDLSEINNLEIQDTIVNSNYSHLYTTKYACFYQTDNNNCIIKTGAPNLPDLLIVNEDKTINSVEVKKVTESGAQLSSVNCSVDSDGNILVKDNEFSPETITNEIRKLKITDLENNKKLPINDNDAKSYFIRQCKENNRDYLMFINYNEEVKTIDLKQDENNVINDFGTNNLQVELIARANKNFKAIDKHGYNRLQKNKNISIEKIDDIEYVKLTPSTIKKHCNECKSGQAYKMGEFLFFKKDIKKNKIKLLDIKTFTPFITGRIWQKKTDI